MKYEDKATEFVLLDAEVETLRRAAAMRGISVNLDRRKYSAEELADFGLVREAYNSQELRDLGVTSREIVDALPEQVGSVTLPVLEGADRRSALQG